MHACSKELPSFLSGPDQGTALSELCLCLQHHMHFPLVCPFEFLLPCILTMQTCSPINAACHLTLQIRVAEFQSETVRCTVSGSGFPGLARQHQLAGLTASLGSTLPEEAPIWGKAKTGRLPKGTITTGKGGAGISLCRFVTFPIVPLLSPSACHHICLSCLGICRSHKLYSHTSIQGNAVSG